MQASQTNLYPALHPEYFPSEKSARSASSSGSASSSHSINPNPQQPAQDNGVQALLTSLFSKAGDLANHFTKENRHAVSRFFKARFFKTLNGLHQFKKELGNDVKTLRNLEDGPAKKKLIELFLLEKAIILRTKVKATIKTALIISAITTAVFFGLGFLFGSLSFLGIAAIGVLVTAGIGFAAHKLFKNDRNKRDAKRIKELIEQPQ